MRSQGDNGHMATRYLFVRPDGSCCLEAVHFRHLAIHKDQIEGVFFNSIDGLPPVGNNRDLATEVLEMFNCDQLIDWIVFRQQDAGFEMRLQPVRFGVVPECLCC